MTITSETTRSYHAGTGGVFNFATGFKFLANADLLVVLQKANGIDYTQVLDTDYTVSGAGAGAGGTVAMVVAPLNGEFLSIIQEPTRTQEHDYTSGDDFPADSHETALDRVTVVAQRSRDLVERTPNLYDGDVDGSGRYNAQSNRIVELADPVGEQDAVSKAYLDAEIAAAAIDAWVTAVPMASVGHYSDTLGQMQTTRDPYPAASEDLATDLQEEVLSLRYQLEEIVKAVNNDAAARWYHDLVFSQAIELLAEYNPSAAAEVDIPLTGGHPLYTIQLIGLRPSTDDRDLAIYASVDAGVSFLTGADYSYSHLEQPSDTGAVVEHNAAGAGAITLAANGAGEGFGNDTLEGINGRILVYPGLLGGAPSYATIEYSISWYINSIFNRMRGSGVVIENQDVDAIRLDFSASATITGKILVYAHREVT